MRERLRQYIRSNGTSPPVHRLAQASQKFLRAYYNEDFYDGAKNGEDRIVDVLAAATEGVDFVAIDAGAHRGFWTALVLEQIPTATVFCSELVSPIRDNLTARFASNPGVQVLDFGLSSTSAKVDVTHNLTHDSTNSIQPDAQSKYFRGSELVVLNERVDTGDNLVAAQAIERIDMLKIDVEGHEVDVIQGFATTLGSASAPRVIQFEYGDTFLPFRHTLREIYDLLCHHGYVIGRVYPDRVAFKDYELSDDHFRMGNYVAVKAKDTLRTALS